MARSLLPLYESPIDRMKCEICGSPSRSAGEVDGKWAGRRFLLRTCDHCRFSFVANPMLEFDRLYDRAYYEGRGADTKVDYVHELANMTSTIRQYEWRGIGEVVSTLIPVTDETVWLDFGCGHGGLVAYARAAFGCEAVGIEDGWISEAAREKGLPVLGLDKTEQYAGRCDVVTMIEVIEHLVEPVKALATARAMLRPGGLLFITTGNAQPYRERLSRWGYVCPEVHISFFEPETLALAINQVGLMAEFPARPPGWDQIIRFKILKNLMVRRQSWLEAAVPWRPVSRLVDHRLGVSRHPVAWAK